MAEFESLLYFLGFIMLAGVLFGIGRSIYWLFDHTGWQSDAVPDLNATITDISSKEVKYVKNGAKFKTTVTFSDGFYFITHKTNRDQHFMTYTISVDDSLKSEIVSRAMEAHNKAATKRLG